MVRRIALLCLITLVATASAPVVESDPLVAQFERFCLGEVSSLKDLTDRPAAAGWSSATFPSDYRFDKADINLAWQGKINDKAYELLISSVSKRKNNSLMCILRTRAVENAEQHLGAFKSAMKNIGLDARESVPPHVYKYRGKTVHGRSAQAELASALLVRLTNIHGRLPDTIYLKLSVLY